MKIKPVSILRWIPALLWMVLIFLFSNQPGGDSGNLSKLVLDWFAGIGLDLRVVFGDHAFLFIRKLAHFTEYFILFALLVLAFGDFPRHRWRILGLTILYAASDEFHQLFIPGRVGDLLDVGIDSLGALAGFGFFSLVQAWRRRKRTS